MLDAGVIMVLEGGIGSTIDMLHMSTALFREQDVPLIGVIINKVRPDKVDEVRHYVGKWLDQNNIPLLGIAPYDETLAYPLLGTVSKAVKGEVLYFKENLDNRIENMLAGSLVNLEALRDKNNVLLIASSRTLERGLKKVKTLSKRSEVADSPLSGVIITGEVELDDESLNYIHNHEIPVIWTHFDTFGAVTKINGLEVKINRRTPWKVKRAVEIVNECVDLDRILEITGV